MDLLSNIGTFSTQKTSNIIPSSNFTLFSTTTTVPNYSGYASIIPAFSSSSNYITTSATPTTTSTLYCPTQTSSLLSHNNNPNQQASFLLPPLELQNAAESAIATAMMNTALNGIDTNSNTNFGTLPSTAVFFQKPIKIRVKEKANNKTTSLSNFFF